MDKEILLLKLGELTLKGLNRHTFESVLIKNIKNSLKPFGEFDIQILQSTVYITPKNLKSTMDEVLERAQKIFGVVSLSRAYEVPKDLNKISKKACEYLKNELINARSFKVECKRADKNFPFSSPDICAEVGACILENFKNLKVDVHNPETIVYIEIRDFAAYVRSNAKKGAGGLPIGTSGRGLVLISGGIDSPVASFMMAKRGMKLYAVHFISPPYTSERAEKKVIKLIEKISIYSGNIKLFIVPFTKIQEKIHHICHEELFTILMRRIMFFIANIIADKEICSALITGESLGQVASQTIESIKCTDEICKIPVLRPLIGMDKDEIVSISRKINTFETSILPFEDCCTVFTPKHPKTRPRLNDVLEEEKKLDISCEVKEAINNIKVLDINCQVRKE